MNNEYMKSYWIVLVFFLAFFVDSGNAGAVPPPDFLFNAGSQLAQVFTISLLFISAILVTIRQFVGIYFMKWKKKKIVWVFLAIGAISISLYLAQYFDSVSERRSYMEWIERSESENKAGETKKSKSMKSILEEISFESDKVKVKRPEAEDAENPYVLFIREYYENLSEGKIAAAYDVSKKSVDFETFESWYRNVTRIVVEQILPIDDTMFSVIVSLEEGNEVTRFGVLMTLREDDTGKIGIENSDVRVLSDTRKTNETLPENADRDESFYKRNSMLSESISNEEFQRVIDSGNEIFVLDAREDEEYDIGRFSGSEHVRFADLLSGEWIRIPTDRVVYVFCWSGMRGEEVAQFLRSKKIVSRYIEKGAFEWVNDGGNWDGGISFSSKYSEERYTRLFSLDEMKERIKNGTVIVDSRKTEKYEKWNIEGSINIPILYTPSRQIEEILDKVPKGKSVITVCDDFISCFDAKVTGIKLEKKGHEFLGRYNKPWEYRDNS